MKNILLVTLGVGIAYLLFGSKNSKLKLPPVSIPETSEPFPSPNSDIAGIRSRMTRRKITNV